MASGWFFHGCVISRFGGEIGLEGLGSKEDGSKRNPGPTRSRASEAWRARRLRRWHERVPIRWQVAITIGWGLIVRAPPPPDRSPGRSCASPTGPQVSLPPAALTAPSSSGWHRQASSSPWSAISVIHRWVTLLRAWVAVRA